LSLPWPNASLMS